MPKKKKNKKKLKRIRFLGITILIITAFTLFLLSDLFNIKNIKVVGNSKIQANEIINLSRIQLNQNMFKFLGLKVRDNIKENPYIEKVKTHRKLDRNNRN